ncbi:Transmembrane protein 126A-like, partial [Homarus americanus]
MSRLSSIEAEARRGAEVDAFHESITLIHEWKPTSDVFALKNYMFALSALSSGSGAYINSYYRKVVKLRNQAFISTLLPVVILPSVVASLLHHHFVQRPLVLQTFQCPVCLELRGGAVQFFAGFVYPMVLGPLAAFQFATRLYTYALPSVSEPKAWIKEFFKMTRPVLPKLYVLAGLQVTVILALVDEPV